MAVSSPTFKPIVATGAIDITIVESTTVLGQTSLTLPDATKSLVIRSRIPTELKLSTTLGGQYITIKPHCVLRLDGLEITGVEVVGASIGDTCDLEIWYGNTKLNQFGFGVFLAKDFYSHHSEYDSDIPQGLKIKVVYHSVSEKTVGINLILNELK